MNKINRFTKLRRKFFKTYLRNGKDRKRYCILCLHSAISDKLLSLPVPDILGKHEFKIQKSILKMKPYDSKDFDEILND